MLKLIKLAVRSIQREWRSGELLILSISILVAVASTSTIYLFADRLNRTMVNQAAEFLAADLAVSSHTAFPSEWLNQSEMLGLRHASIAEFSTVLMVEEQMLLAGIKAVTANYPLRGQLKTSLDRNQQGQVTASIPPSGEAWVDRRVLARLQLNLGDVIEVGQLPLTITRVVTAEPDHKGNFSSLMPRVLLNYQDLAATQVIQPGSHVHHLQLFAGNEALVKQFQLQLKGQIRPGDRLLDVFENRPELSNAVKRAQQYLGLSSVVVVVIAGVAIAMAARRYSERHFDSTAILRCLGLKQAQILLLYCFQLAIIGILASIVGVLIGWFGQEGLLQLLRELLPTRLASPSWQVGVQAVILGVVILAGFALPPILRQGQVPALRVLRRDMAPLPASGWLVYGLAMLVILALIWPHVNNWQMLAMTLGIGLLIIASFSGLILLLLRGLKTLVHRVAMPWRIGVRNIARHWQVSLAQILAFTLTLTAMLVITHVKTDLLHNWQQQLPANAPNYFVMNVFPDEWQDFQQLLADKDVETGGFYPIVRGRIISLNGADLRTLIKKGSKAEHWLDRDFNMTTALKLPDDNVLAAGQWWGANAKQLVSIEQKIASELGVKLGDKVSYSIGANRIEATVSSLRKVEWDTMNPNFFMIFAPSDLDAFSATYLSSFYLSEQQQTILPSVLKAYPHVTVLEVDLILDQLRKIIQQVSLAIEYLLYFAVVAGILVLFASINASMDERLYHCALLRSFGASAAMLRKAQGGEFFTLGAVSGVLAVILSEVINFGVYQWVFELDYSPSYSSWLLVPLLAGLMVVIAGLLATGKVIKQNPIQVIRQLSL